MTESTDRNVRDEAWEQRLDWALEEAEGAHSAPDVTATVLDRVAGMPSVPRRRAPWLRVAVAILIGTGIVAGTWLLDRDTIPSDGSQGVVGQDPSRGQQPQQPPIEWRHVTNRTEILQLPLDTRHVQATNLSDDDLAALARLRDLRGLRLNARSTKTAGRTAVHLTPAALPQLSQFQQLRHLELSWQSELSGTSLEFLAELPLVEELHLTLFDTTDEHLTILQRMPSLKRLSLRQNQGFRGDGSKTIANVPGLTELNVAHCHQLSIDMLRPIGSMPRLRALNVSGIGRGFRGNQVGAPFDRTKLDRFLAQCKIDGAGLTPEILDVLPEGLVELGLSEAPETFDDSFYRALREQHPALQVLDVAHTKTLTDVGVAELLGLPELRRLDISSCEQVSEFGFELITYSTKLQQVGVGSLPWLNHEHLETLYQKGIRVSPRWNTDPWMRAAVPQLEQRYFQDAATPVAWLTVTATDIDHVPASAVAIDCHDLSDAEVERVLDKAPKLERLRIRTGEQKKFYGDDFSFSPQTSGGNLRTFTGTSLAAVGKMETLVEVMLAGTVALDPRQLAELQQLPDLQHLAIVACDLTDASLATLPGMPSLRSLHIAYSFGWGEKGLRAIQMCHTLEQLRLQGLPLLTGEWLARFGSLRNLELLHLRGMTTVRQDSHRIVSADERQRRNDAVLASERRNAGVTDATLDGIANSRTIVDLAFHPDNCTGASVRALAGLAKLRALEVFHLKNLTTADIAKLPRSLQQLRLPGCSGIDAGVGPALSGMQLRTLVLRSSDITDADVEQLVAEHPLSEELDISASKVLTAASAKLLARSNHISKLHITGCDGWTPELRSQAGSRIVKRKVW